MFHCMVSGLFYHTDCQMAVRNPSLLFLNYSQIEKEALTIVCTVKKFHQYLFGRHVLLYTDHKPLLGLLSEQKGIPSMAVTHIQCWAILLFAYNYSLKYCIGSQNSYANFFSHFPLNSSSWVKKEVFITKLIYALVTSKEIGKFRKETLSFQMLLILFHVGSLPK